MPYIHYIGVKSNEHRQQEINGLTSLLVSRTSLPCLIMICSLVDVTHKEHKWRNGFFRLSWKATSICTEDVKICRQCAAVFLAGIQQGLTIHYELEWLALFLFLITTLTGDVASVMKWRRLREFPPLPQAFITSSSLYKWCIGKICHQEVSDFWHLHHRGIRSPQLFC